MYLALQEPKRVHNASWASWDFGANIFLIFGYVTLGHFMNDTKTVLVLSGAQNKSRLCKKSRLLYHLSHII